MGTVDVRLCEYIFFGEGEVKEIQKLGMAEDELSCRLEINRRD